MGRSCGEVWLLFAGITAITAVTGLAVTANKGGRRGNRTRMGTELTMLGVQKYK